MFISNPDPYSLPAYRIGTFVTQSISRNQLLDNGYAKNATDYMNKRFGENNWIITSNGREAIAIAMQQLALTKEQTTTILTTSGNFYISGCVTSTIQNFTKWNREKTTNTAAYFVNHEFGYLYPNMEDLLKEGLPIIEDCCTTFFSQDENGRIGKYGDFSVFSFPKFFSIQIGGLLVGNGVANNKSVNSKVTASLEETMYILKVVGFELTQNIEILERRKEIYDYAKSKFETLGFTLRFPEEAGIVPSVLLLNNNSIIKDLAAHKEHLLRHGIQSSVFYGEDAFFIPNHNMLTFQDVDYFEFIIRNYINT